MIHVSGPYDHVPLIIGEPGGPVLRVRVIAFHPQVGVPTGSFIDVTGTELDAFLGTFLLEMPDPIEPEPYQPTPYAALPAESAKKRQERDRNEVVAERAAAARAREAAAKAADELAI